MPNNNTTWVVVANSAQAKIFRLVVFPKIEFLTSLQHPESRLHDIDLVSTKPGSTNDRGGTHRSSYQAPSDPKQLEMEKFAKDVTSYLSSACRKKEFSRLYVLAPPTFLGLLRQHMDQKTRDSIVAENAKDMTDHKQDAIERLISEIS